MSHSFFMDDRVILLYKVLDSGRFQWLRNASEVRTLIQQEYRWLLDQLARHEAEPLTEPAAPVG